MITSKPALDEVVNHVRNRSYMSGIERDQARIKATGEIFTPTPLVQKILDQIPDNTFSDPSKTFIDNSCGDGQFLGEVLIRKLEHGIGFEQALSTIYGVDLMQDNVDLCRERLLCGQEHLRHIVEQNIYQADALKFSYEFKPMSETRRQREESNRKRESRNKEKRIKAALEERRKESRKKLEKKLFETVSQCSLT